MGKVHVYAFVRFCDVLYIVCSNKNVKFGKSWGEGCVGIHQLSLSLEA